MSWSPGFYFFFSVRCGLVIVGVPPGRLTAPSGVGRWLFHEVCFLGNFLLAMWLSFLLCGEGTIAAHGLWFVLPVRKGKGLTLLCHFFSCGYLVCSGLFLARISWSVCGAIGCLVGDYSLHFCAWSQIASCFWWAFLFLGYLVLIWAAASCFLTLSADPPLCVHVCRYVQVSIEVRLLFLISDCLYFVLTFVRCCLVGFLMWV